MENVRKTMDDDVVDNLQMIQSTIDRMCTSSAIYKGFAATIVAGLSVVSLSDINKWLLLSCFTMVVSFLILDVYYLQLERRFRFLYEQVRRGCVPADYDLRPPKVKDIKKKQPNSNVRVASCLISYSITLFYVPLLLISVVIILIKFLCP